MGSRVEEIYNSGLS